MKFRGGMFFSGFFTEVVGSMWLKLGGCVELGPPYFLSNSFGELLKAFPARISLFFGSGRSHAAQTGTFEFHESQVVLRFEFRESPSNSPGSQYERPRSVALASFACVDKTTKIITKSTRKDPFITSETSELSIETGIIMK